jgi:colanic acid/amylovoran biosynthesis glycosyltransferase
MRIAFVIDVFPVCCDTFILNQISGLIDRGHTVDIFAQQPGETSKIHSDIAAYNLLERTAYRIPMPENRFLRVLKALGLLITRFFRYDNPGALFRSLNAFEYGRSAGSLRLFYEIASHGGKGPYDIIHCHFGPNGLLWSLMRKLGAIEGRLITTFHGWDVNVLPGVLGNDYLKDVFQNADLCTVSSDFMWKRVRSLGAHDDKLIKLPVGANTRKIAFSPKRIDKKQPIIILTVGRLVEVKGIEYSIRAVARVLPAHPNIQYLIAGDGPLRMDLEDLAGQLGIAGHVRFLGAQTEEEIIELYAKAHIFILAGVVASDGAEEAQGVVLLEAQAAGIAVIATRVGGIPESVSDGKSGILVPPRNVEALAEKLSYLIEHPETRLELGRAGRTHVEANFDSDKLNDRLVEIYQELLQTRTAAKRLN